MKDDKMPLPTKDYANKRKAVIDKAVNHVFTNEEITEMLRMKNSLQSIPKNLASKKADLIRLRSAAEYASNAEEVARLNEAIDKLDQVSSERKRKVNQKLDAWTKLNERNRKMNQVESRQAELLMNQIKRSSPKKKQTEATISSLSSLDTSINKAFDSSLQKHSSPLLSTTQDHSDKAATNGTLSYQRKSKLEQLFDDVEFDL